MATSAQIQFFDQCLSERKLPAGQSEEDIRRQFAPLSKDAASKWIDRIRELPKKDAGEGDNTPPPF